MNWHTHLHPNPRSAIGVRWLSPLFLFEEDSCCRRGWWLIGNSWLRRKGFRIRTRDIPFPSSLFKDRDSSSLSVCLAQETEWNWRAIGQREKRKEISTGRCIIKNQLLSESRAATQFPSFPPHLGLLQSAKKHHNPGGGQAYSTSGFHLFLPLHSRLLQAAKRFPLLPQTPSQAPRLLSAMDPPLSSSPCLLSLWNGLFSASLNLFFFFGSKSIYVSFCHNFAQHQIYLLS